MLDGDRILCIPLVPWWQGPVGLWTTSRYPSVGHPLFAGRRLVIGVPHYDFQSGPHN